MDCNREMEIKGELKMSNQKITGNLEVAGDIKIAGGGSISGENIVTSLANYENYVKLNNGLILQWGTAIIDVGNASTKTISLPTAFNTTSYGVVCYHYAGVVSNDYINSFKIVSRSTTNFQVKKHMNEKSEQLIWVAIGK